MTLMEYPHQCFGILHELSVEPFPKTAFSGLWITSVELGHVPMRQQISGEDEGDGKSRNLLPEQLVPGSEDLTNE